MGQARIISGRLVKRGSSGLQRYVRQQQRRRRATGRAIVDLRGTLADGQPSWLNGDYGKARYGGDSELRTARADGDRGSRS